MVRANDVPPSLQRAAYSTSAPVPMGLPLMTPVHMRLTENNTLGNASCDDDTDDTVWDQARGGTPDLAALDLFKKSSQLVHTPPTVHECDCTRLTLTLTGGCCRLGRRTVPARLDSLSPPRQSAAKA